MTKIKLKMNVAYESAHTRKGQKEYQISGKNINTMSRLRVRYFN